MDSLKISLCSEERGMRAPCIWFCGFSGAGKTTIACLPRQHPAQRGHAAFVPVFVDTPPDECARRDPKGLYAAARRGELRDFAGLSSPFEAPARAEVHVRGQIPEEAAQTILRTEAPRNRMAAPCR